MERETRVMATIEDSTHNGVLVEWMMSVLPRVGEYMMLGQQVWCVGSIVWMNAGRVRIIVE